MPTVVPTRCCSLLPPPIPPRFSAVDLLTWAAFRHSWLLSKRSTSCLWMPQSSSFAHSLLLAPILSLHSSSLLPCTPHHWTTNSWLFPATTYPGCASTFSLWCQPSRLWTYLWRLSYQRDLCNRSPESTCGRARCMRSAWSGICWRMTLLCWTIWGRCHFAPTSLRQTTSTRPWTSQAR